MAMGSKSALYQDESPVEGKGRQYPTLCSSLRSLGSENCAKHCSGIDIVSDAGIALSTPET